MPLFLADINATGKSVVSKSTIYVRTVKNCTIKTTSRSVIAVRCVCPTDNWKHKESTKKYISIVVYFHLFYLYMKLYRFRRIPPHYFRPSNSFPCDCSSNFPSTSFPSNSSTFFPSVVFVVVGLLLKFSV